MEDDLPTPERKTVILSDKLKFLLTTRNKITLSYKTNKRNIYNYVLSANKCRVTYTINDLYYEYLLQYKIKLTHFNWTLIENNVSELTHENRKSFILCSLEIIIQLLTQKNVEAYIKKYKFDRCIIEYPNKNITLNDIKQIINNNEFEYNNEYNNLNGANIDNNSVNDIIDINLCEQNNMLMDVMHYNESLFEEQQINKAILQSRV